MERTGEESEGEVVNRATYGILLSQPDTTPSPITLPHAAAVSYPWVKS